MTKCVVISLNVSEEQYNLIQEELEKMIKYKQIYKYNILGLILAGIHKNIKTKNKFYCSEFVRYILAKGKIDLSEIPDVVYPVNFLSLKNKKIEYEGLLKEYKELDEKRLVEV